MPRKDYFPQDKKVCEKHKRSLVHRWVMALACKWQGHKYFNGYFATISVRHWRRACSRKGKHLYKEFQCECTRCGAKTKWKKWRYLEAFERQHGFYF